MAFTALPIRRSIPLGIAAYLVGYLLSVVAASSRTTAILEIAVTGQHVDSATLGEIFATPPSQSTTGGLLFYNAHFIPTSVPMADALNGFASLTHKSLLLTVDGALLGLFLVPFLALLAAGCLTVKTGPTHGVHGATYGGASVALAYVPLLIIGAFILRATVPTAPTVASPSGLLSISIGLVYTLVLGALGGKIGSIVDNARHHLNPLKTKARLVAGSYYPI